VRAYLPRLESGLTDEEFLQFEPTEFADFLAEEY
jgi:hypothetical protein